MGISAQEQEKEERERKSTRTSRLEAAWTGIGMGMGCAGDDSGQAIRLIGDQVPVGERVVKRSRPSVSVRDKSVSGSIWVLP